MKNKLFAVLAGIGVAWLGLMLAIIGAARATNRRPLTRHDPVEVPHGAGAPR